ncbi:MAG: hypothetical protein ABIE36_02865 [Candidatus Diapherotrites archaeon]
MSFKKIFLTTLILSSLFLNDCKNDKNKTEISKNIKIESKEFNSSIEKILLMNSKKDSPNSKNSDKHNEYLSMHTKGNPLLEDEMYLKNKIAQSMKLSKHSYGKEKKNNEDFYDINDLSLKQLQRIFLVLESLKNPSSLQEIGKIIKDDVADKYAEHGGIILSQKDKIYFKTLESWIKRDTMYNEMYGFQDKDSIPPNLGSFHLHASVYDEEKHANPSSRDIIISFYTVDVYKEAHEFLITSLKKGSFNVDYYGGDKTKGPLSKILDLGNYSYDTLKIE